jgi:hypothetical protein
MSWWESCKSCCRLPGGDDPETSKVWLFAALLTFPLVTFGAYMWLTGRGIRITGTDCAWQDDTRSYVANARLESAHNEPKAVTVRLLGHFRPPADRKWPDPVTKARYADVSEMLPIILRAEGTGTVTARFAFPGVERFDCRAEAWVVGQESQARLEARRLKQGLSALNGEMRRNQRAVLEDVERQTRERFNAQTN